VRSVANTVGFTNIDTILYISRSATTVTKALGAEIHSDFRVCFPRAVNSTCLISEKSHSDTLQFLSSYCTFCEYFSVHSIDDF